MDSCLPQPPHSLISLAHMCRLFQVFDVWVCVEGIRHTCVVFKIGFVYVFVYFKQKYIQKKVKEQVCILEFNQ